MTQATGLLFTSMTCPHCPKAKEIFTATANQRTDISMHHLMTHEPQAQELAKKFGVQSVPTFIFYGPGHETPMGLIGVQSETTLNKYIDIALGLQKHKEEKDTKNNKIKEKKEFSLRKLFKKT